MNKPQTFYDKDIKISGKSFYWLTKRFLDIIISFSLFPILIGLTLPIIFLNIFFNNGATFYIQKRMGKNCKPFYAIKFRTMIDTGVISRKYSDPLEVERITKLGLILRNTRIDELPQIINVIKGDMSLIGPRPDYYEHAIIFLESDPNYYSRHLVKPGISGLSQIRLGYAEGLSDTKRKSKVDMYYIENANFYLDVKIFIGTIIVIIKGIYN